MTGVAGMVVSAEKLKKAKAVPKRQSLFMNFGGKSSNNSSNSSSRSSSTSSESSKSTKSSVASVHRMADSVHASAHGQISESNIVRVLRSLSPNYFLQCRQLREILSGLLTQAARLEACVVLF